MVLREIRATRVLLVWTCRVLRERREPPGSQEAQVLTDSPGHRASLAGMDLLETKVRPTGV